MAKEQQQPQQEKQAGPVEERIIFASLNGVVNIPGLGQHQTIAIEENGPVLKLQAHRLGLALTMKPPSQQPDEFFVVPWANIGVMKIKLVSQAPDKKG